VERLWTKYTWTAELRADSGKALWYCVRNIWARCVATVKVVMSCRGTHSGNVEVSPLNLTVCCVITRT
jgi:hypothetical protein